MNFFHPLDGHVLLRAAGVFSEHQLYHHNGEIFARRGNGFVRLLDHQATSKSRVFWSDLRLDTPHEIRIGKLVLAPPARRARKAA